MRRAVTLILLAGGHGNRFGGPDHKQFIKILGKPVYLHALDAYRSAFGSALRTIVIVVPKAKLAPMRRAVAALEHPDICVIAGGRERIGSYFSAIRFLAEERAGTGVVIAHDAVRPAVEPALIRKAYRKFESSHADALITLKPLAESLFRREKGYAVCVDRDDFGIGQTPYIFRSSALMRIWKAWRGRERILRSTVDIFELAQRSGIKATYVRTDIPNPKLTYPEDLATIRALLVKRL